MLSLSHFTQSRASVSLRAKMTERRVKECWADDGILTKNAFYFINLWLKKKGTPYPLFEGVFIEIHFEAKPLSAKKLPYQDVRSRASHHPFWPNMPVISFWLKKGYPLSTFWGCLHWNSCWSKTIECQEAPISGCSFKSFASPILTKHACH